MTGALVLQAGARQGDQAPLLILIPGGGDRRAALGTQHRPQVDRVVVGQAGVQLAGGRQADAVAGVAEGLADGGDQADALHAVAAVESNPLKHLWQLWAVGDGGAILQYQR